jgi:hypothetical protein
MHLAITSQARKETYWTKVWLDTFVCQGGHSAEPAEHFHHWSAKAAGLSNLNASPTLSRNCAMQIKKAGRCQGGPSDEGIDR